MGDDKKVPTEGKQLVHTPIHNLRNGAQYRGGQ